jgi:hypothetical protein
VDVEVTATDAGASTANAWLGRAKMLTKAKARAAAKVLFMFLLKVNSAQ